MNKKFDKIQLFRFRASTFVVESGECSGRLSRLCEHALSRYAMLVTKASDGNDKDSYDDDDYGDRDVDDDDNDHDNDNDDDNNGNAAAMTTYNENDNRRRLCLIANTPARRSIAQ